MSDFLFDAGVFVGQLDPSPGAQGGKRLFHFNDAMFDSYGLQPVIFYAHHAVAPDGVNLLKKINGVLPEMPE
jgi:hypothetical protein